MTFPFFEWCEATMLGQLVRNSVWLFPVIEALHLLALSLLGGALLVVDLRLLGVGMTGASPSTLARSARPWLVTAVGAMLVTGLLLFLSEAVKCYYNQSFWVKILTLPVAIAFTFLVRQPAALADTTGRAPRSRLVGAISIVLWFVVAAAGRWIGFS